MDVFNEQVLSYLTENTTTIDKILEEYNKTEEIKKDPDQNYIREVQSMSNNQRYYQMKFEQQLDLLIHYHSLAPNEKIYLTPKCINKAIKTTNQLKGLMNSSGE